ncbi:MAG: hypothetical protein DSY66_01640 [Persephonella sp.]|nr:MAG: hypothetical protein DSY66_01640 [Persephonella sp.]
MKEIDLSILPEEAQKELIEFYEYLVEKYKRKGQINEYNTKIIEKLLPKSVGSFEPIKREDLYGR